VAASNIFFEVRAITGSASLKDPWLFPRNVDFSRVALPSGTQQFFTSNKNGPDTDFAEYVEPTTLSAISDSMRHPCNFPASVTFVPMAIETSRIHRT